MEKLSIVIPAYNEEKRIGKTLDSVKNYFSDSEIIVVSNGSRDKTVEVVEKFCEKNKNFRCLDFKEKLGKGGALIEGIKESKNELVGFLDADDAFNLDYVVRMANELKNYDVVIASKWKNQTIFKVDEPFIRKVLSRVWNLMVRIILGLKFKDTQAGAKFFRKNKLDMSKDFICKDFSFDIELLYRLKKFKILEMYVPSKFEEGSTFSYKHAFSMFKNMFRLRFR